MSNIEIALTVNGREVRGEVEPRTHLADYLREELLLTGTHIGCEQGVCGACTVMINGRPSRSCITLAAACDSADIRTIENFDDDPLMAKIREAFTAHHGLQCGFCTPGLLATAYDVVRRIPDADETRIRKELSGNLCRCTGYQGAVNAIAHVLTDDPPAAALLPAARTRPRTASKVATSVSAARAPAQSGTTLTVPDQITDGVRLERRIAIAAPAEQVWRVLEDIESVAGCVPGAEVTGMDGANVRGVMTVAIGPMHANFDGTANVDIDGTSRSGRVIGRGGDRLTRSSVDGEMTFRLHTAGPATSELELDILYLLKGPLAQFGRPAIVAEVADRILSTTAGNISARATGVEAPTKTAKPASGFGLIWSALVGLFKSLFKR